MENDAKQRSAGHREARFANGWSGGQYSLFRIAVGFGALIFLGSQLRFLRLFPVEWNEEAFRDTIGGYAWRFIGIVANDGALIDHPDPPLAFLTLSLAGMALCLPLIVGWFDRAAALILGLLLILFFFPPVHQIEAFLLGGLLAIVHARSEPAPYGSWSARGRADPDGGWRRKPTNYLRAWLLLIVGCFVQGAVFWDWLMRGDPYASDWVLFETVLRETAMRMPAAFRSLMLWIAIALMLLGTFGRRIRPVLWCALLIFQCSMLILLRDDTLPGVMLLLHFAAFDPAWIRPRRADAVERIFYDGRCALCHGAVRFVLAEDREGLAFRFAPLESAAFRRAFGEEQRARLPDSVVALAASGEILTRSRAFVHILRRLGGLWRLLGEAAALLPAWLLDRLYNFIARIRYRAFGTRDDACPVISETLRSRFDLEG